jgi:N6-L-threonylcarbamoyladenine synthase
VGINFARALAEVWNVPIVPINHMEGHILSSIFDGSTIPELVFPVIALLISGGHTELVLMKDWASYECVGQTRDDAVGEAFDKVARMLGLPYPGGPEISKLAMIARERGLESSVKLPRPMLESDNLDFSFSGIKTAVRYALEGKEYTQDERAALALEFEEAVTTVLLAKARTAVEMYNAQTLILGGGVSANTHIRETFKPYFRKQYPMLMVYMPPRNLTTDNSIMIALAGHARKDCAITREQSESITACGNLSLAQ